jgi:glycosyltransferase involved in cell wall biosynthesis
MTVTMGFTNDPRVRKEATSLATAGFRVTVCSFDRTLSFKKSENYRGVIVKRLRASLPFGKLLKALFLMPIFLFFCTLQSLILRPTVIHCHDFDTMGAGIITKIFSRETKLVYDAHEHYPSMIRSIVPPPLYHLSRMLDHVFTTVAECVIVPSLCRAKLYPTARDMIEVPYVPSKEDAPRFTTKSDRFTIYYGGVLLKETGIVKLIGLACKLEGVRLVLAGNGPLSAFVIKQAESKPNVNFLGSVDRSKSLELLGS